MTGKRVLVTGGLGFIGSHLVEKLLDCGDDVTILDKPKSDLVFRRFLESVTRSPRCRFVHGNILDLDTVIKASESVEVIYHLAALASHRLSIGDPHLYHHVNIMGTLNILEAARRREPAPRVVFSSSSSVYGTQPPPLIETMHPQPQGPYALSKLIGEKLCSQYAELYRIPVVTVRYFNVIGERSRGNIVTTIFAGRIMDGKPPVVYGRRDPKTGDFTPASRDFTYAKDAVEGTILAAENTHITNEVFNIGTGVPNSVLDLANMIIAKLDSTGQLKPELGELAPHESLTGYCNNDKARKQLKWNPRFTVQDAVDRYCTWYKEQTGGLGS